MLFYVASPYRADTDEQFDKQLEMTKKISREIVSKGFDVIVPHLTLTQFLDDDVKEERQSGIESGLRMLKICDALFVYTGMKVSKGMETEIDKAVELNMSVYFFRNMNELRDLLKKQTTEYRSVNAKVTHTVEQKCEDCLHHPKRGQNFKDTCGVCSLFYGNEWEKRI